MKSYAAEVTRTVVDVNWIEVSKVRECRGGGEGALIVVVDTADRRVGDRRGETKRKVTALHDEVGDGAADVVEHRH